MKPLVTSLLFLSSLFLTTEVLSDSTRIPIGTLSFYGSIAHSESFFQVHLDPLPLGLTIELGEPVFYINGLSGVFLLPDSCEINPKLTVISGCGVSRPRVLLWRGSSSFPRGKTRIMNLLVQKGD